MGWTTTYPSTPLFVADWNSIARNTGRQVDWTRVPDSYKGGTTYTITTTAQAAAAATSIAVSALTVALPTGTVLDFTGAGEFATLTAPAAVGATSLVVEALDAQIESGDTASYIVSGSNAKVIKAGTVMCQLSSGKMVPRVNRPGSEEAIGLLMTMAEEGNRSDALTGYGVIVGGVIYETLLPETITSYKTELETNGTSWVWAVYADTREV
jgi:hypothetical protein